MYPQLLVANTCSLLAAIISELSASATGTEVSGFYLGLEPTLLMTSTLTSALDVGVGIFALT